MPSRTVARAFRTWAAKTHPKCYLCAYPLEFDSKDRPQSYTLDHIWPQVYGGDSDLDNMLPACYLCNGSAKRDFASWSTVGIQALIHGIDADPSSLGKIPRSQKYALLRKTVQKFANKRRCSLKRAFLRVGPWTEVRVIDATDVSDFHNVVNCKDSVLALIEEA